MPILFPDCCEYTWYPCASHMFFDELCCFYAAAMLLVLLCNCLSDVASHVLAMCFCWWCTNCQCPFVRIYVLSLWPPCCL
jgi:hypothetical protein